MNGRPEGGFTLAEVAVTIVIVGIALVLCLQGLNGAKLQAAYTRNLKLARELAEVTLGEVGSGVWAAEVQDGLIGSYADRGYPEFSYELVVGEDQLSDYEEPDRRTYDSWKSKDDEDEQEQEAAQPFEKVRIRVVFPQIQDFEDSLILEQWFPWDQVYGDAEEQKAAGIEIQNGAVAAPASTAPTTAPR